MNNVLKVLVVDDDPAIAAITSECLQTLGCAVTTVHSAADALALCHGTSRFDVLITDWNMPEMTGKELVEKLGELSPDERPGRIFVYTGNIFNKPEEVAPHATLIYKPCSREQLQSYVFGKNS